MDPWLLVLRQHAGTHAGQVAGLEGVWMGEQPFHEVTDQQIRVRPHGLNSIAWLMWHVARCEDVVANTILNQRRQVFDSEEWPARLNIFRRDIGTEMTGDEVAELSAAVNISNLRAYRIAVVKQTREWIQSLSMKGLEDLIPETGVRRAVDEGALSAKAMWVGELWFNRPQPWFLYWEIIGHNYLHLGQALWVKKLVTT